MIIHLRTKNIAPKIRPTPTVTALEYITILTFTEKLRDINKLYLYFCICIKPWTVCLLESIDWSELFQLITTSVLHFRFDDKILSCYILSYFLQYNLQFKSFLKSSVKLIPSQDANYACNALREGYMYMTTSGVIGFDVSSPGNERGDSFS